MSLLPDWNSIESVRAAHSLLEGMAIVFFIVLAGLEAVAHILEKRRHELAEAIEVVALFFFAIAVIAEFHAYPYSLRLDTLSAQQDRIQREKISTLDNSTQALKTEAEKAHKEAEDERMARETLEEGIAWRRIPKEVRARLGAAMARFSGERAGIGYNLNDLEASGFATDIAIALHDVARWNISEPQAVMKIREGPVPVGANPPLDRGVVIVHTPDERSGDASTLLANELNAIGFDARVASELSKETRPVVYIWSEPRPEGPQGAAKIRTKKAKKSP